MTLSDPVSSVTPRRGHDVYVLAKEETTYGETPSDFYTDAVYLDMSGDTLALERSNLFSSGVRNFGYRQDRVVSGAGGVAVGGDLLLDAQWTGLELFFYGVPVAFVFLVPALAMKLWPDELKSGTVELLVKTRDLRLWTVAESTASVTPA